MPRQAEIIWGRGKTDTERFITSADWENFIISVNIPTRDVDHLVWSLENAFTINPGFNTLTLTLNR